MICGITQKPEAIRMSAIDTAITNNQMRGIKLILDYIIKYQNSYVHSYLFKDNFVKLMDIGVEVTDLLNSNVFVYRFDFHEWPSIHNSNAECLKTYNKTIFELKQSYLEVFSDLEKEGSN